MCSLSVKSSLNTRSMLIATGDLVLVALTKIM